MVVCKIDPAAAVPIGAAVGKNIPTSKSEEIIVEMVEPDGQDRVLIKEA